MHNCCEVNLNDINCEHPACDGSPDGYERVRTHCFQ